MAVAAAPGAEAGATGVVRVSRAIRPTRATRRVLLALLTNATNLSGYPLSRAAQVNSGTVYIVLSRLEEADAPWVVGEWGPGEEGHRRRFYRLTPYGRIRALRMLGLEVQ